MEGLKQKLSEYYQYLDDVGKRLYRIAVTFVIFFFLGFLGSGQILKLIISLFKLENAEIVTTSPFQFFDLAMNTGLYTGLVVCLPVFVYQLYGFLQDGLNKNEKKTFFVLLPIGLTLFVAGFAYSFIVLYSALNSIATINISLGIKNLWDIDKFLSQIILTSVLLGLLFQFPIILTFLMRVGLVTARFLQEKRRQAITAMFVFTSLLPPTDGLSLIIMVLPLVVIYELTILVNSILSYKGQINLSVEVEDNNLAKI